MCHTSEETLKHFLSECPELNIIRNKLKDANTEHDKIRRLLCFEKNKELIEEGKKTIEEMWKARKKRIQENL